MIPVDCSPNQHDPANGRWGDCYRACLASILELQTAQVPHFIQDRATKPEWRDDERAWLSARGLQPIIMVLKLPLPTILECLGPMNPGVHYIVGGMGANGMPHAVVACGASIVHDPGNVGIAGPVEGGQHVLTFVGALSAPHVGIKSMPLVDVSPLDRHERIGLMFSGGKDSLALVYMLRPFWDRLTVYHADAGDLLPETVEVVAAVEAMVPSFVRLNTDSRAWRRENGLPSDIVPWSCTPFGRAFKEGGRVTLVDRFACCRASLWEPIFERARADGVTLEIIGTKASDPGGDATRMMAGMQPGQSTVTVGDIERWFPLNAWSDEEVFSYLRDVGAPIARYYEGGVSKGPECATCSAYWDEGRAAYLAKHHPEKAAAYMADLQTIGLELRAPFMFLTTELAAGGVPPPGLLPGSRALPEADGQGRGTV
ncbi:MAG: Bcep22 3 [Devosia sp.]|uniref:phosphoadenosine phosphosulfate reductase domain-containing protein n=1 Tax=Devosia sp. TaxID=1871048 RepID=UPI00260C0B5B|nr:phosphoadenosine phosphosulfate reductase family protein [Devosia sp.]MDB5541901.1 Bcep22 3 [Devosia sp.]